MVAITELRSSKELDADLPTTDRIFDNLHSQSCSDSSNGHVLLPDVTSHISANDAGTAHACHGIAYAEILFTERRLYLLSILNLRY